MSKLASLFKAVVVFPFRILARLVNSIAKASWKMVWKLVGLVFHPVIWALGQAFRPVRFAYRVTVSQFPNVLAASIAVISFLFVTANFGPAIADADLVDVSESVPSVVLDLGESVFPGGDVDLGEDVALGVDGSQGDPGDGSTGTVGGGSSRMALLMQVLMLEKAEAVLSALPGYTTTFSKQEVVGDELTDEQVMEVKIRHEPFSVYMKWTTGHKGRQVLYVDGEHKGRMLVKLGGWKKRLPALKLDPSGSMAMKESRYPITKAGLLELVRESLAIRRGEMAKLQGVRCQLIENHEFDGRPCYAFVVEYADRSASDRYRKSEMLFDRELGVPVVVRNFSWPAEGTEGDATDESTLVEFYTYRNIKFQREVAGGDFDRANKAYRF